ncbi:MAG: PqqD family peptide modification chaperone [Acidobacteria bacterium]|jgi:hypothetical protein|nr:PqqD family peptide modification chaperone [Acidobacteriota bacterium]
MAQRFLRNPDVSCNQAASSPYLLNADNGALQGINETGLLIWRMLSRPLAADEIVARLLRHCGMDEPGAGGPGVDAAADVAAFLAKLRDSGFIGWVLDGDDAAETLPLLPVSPATTAPENGAATRPERSIYRGRSMRGTFQPGDALVLEPTPLEAIRPGDVVVFRGSKPADADRSTSDVVHRVVSLADGGLVTRGDANRSLDSETVRADNLRGRVRRLERNGRSRRVLGGRLALLLVRLRRAGQELTRSGKKLLRALGWAPYSWLRRSGAVRRFWRPEIFLLALPARGEAEGEGAWLIKYVYRQRTVALWQPVLRLFRCRKPYDLILVPPEEGAKNA